MINALRDITKRRNAYGTVFLISGLAIGCIGLLSLWMPDLFSSFLLKAILSCGVIAALSAVLLVMTFANQEDKLTKKMAFVIGVSSALLSIILIGQIWFSIFEGILLGKLAATLIVISMLAGFVLSVWDDFFESKRLKDENYLD